MQATKAEQDNNFISHPIFTPSKNKLKSLLIEHDAAANVAFLNLDLILIDAPNDAVYSIF